MKLTGFDIKCEKLFLQKELVSKDQMNKAIKEAISTRDSLVGVMIKRNHLSFEDAQKILKDELRAELVSLVDLKINTDVFDLLSKEQKKKYLAIPIDKVNGKVMIAMANPSNLLILDEIKMLLRTPIQAVLSPKAHIEDCFEKESDEAQDEEGTDSIDEIMSLAEGDLEIVEADSSGDEDIFKDVNEAPVIKLTNKILLESIKKGASDIFIEPWEKTMRIRCRVDGLLEELKSPPKSLANTIVSRIKVMSQLDIAERRLPQDGRFKIKVQKRTVDFRVSVLPTTYGEKVCLRILDRTAQAQNLDTLGFREDELKRIRASADKPNGLILVTGPTGSGKTSTLYSVLNYLDSPDKNITTVEDPVEYMLTGINQVNCKESVGLTFSSALRSILRQDPDIVMLGEIRDKETIDIATKAALTGHLVLSTLHTNDACSSIIRMRNMGVEPFLIASTVIMISAQRLIRKLCDSCKEKYIPDESICEKFQLYKFSDKPVLYKPRACSECRDTGYKGRTVITEVLVVTEAIKELIMKDAKVYEIEKQAKKEGMHNLRESALFKALAGITSLEEVMRITVENKQGEEDAA